MHEEYKYIGHVNDCLIEEIGELLQAMGKYYRFGKDSFHPDDPDKKTNYESLMGEIDDVQKRLNQFKLLIEGEQSSK
jgi:NTP pyrophosphatase (non-canonical NTP hydrolase)